jgi:hypothetical protein
MNRFSFVATVVGFILLALWTRPAHAYLDPASGSVILQVIVAAVAAVLITLKAFWHKIRGLFGGRKAEEAVEKVEEEPQP